MAQHRDKNAQMEDYKLREKRVIIPFSIVHNATPASKTNSNDLPSSLTLSLEGQTATATAIDSGCAFTTETDSTGIFGCLVSSCGTVAKLLDVQLVNLSSGTATVTRVGASSTGVTASGNIAVSIDWNGSLATTDFSANLVLEYSVSKA